MGAYNLSHPPAVPAAPDPKVPVCATPVTPLLLQIKNATYDGEYWYIFHNLFLLSS